MRKWDFTILQVNFHSGDEVQLKVIPDYERLDEDFEIHEGLILPVGRAYDFTRYRVEANTASRRLVSMRAEVETGEFYSGSRREFSLTMGVRPRPGVLVNLEAEWNRVRLAEGRFSTRLYRLVLNTQFGPWISLVNNVQYDSVSAVLGWQSRYRWILRPGNDVYVVYTHNWIENELPGRRFSTLDRRAASKIIYTHRF